MEYLFGISRINYNLQYFIFCLNLDLALLPLIHADTVYLPDVLNMVIMYLKTMS